MKARGKGAQAPKKPAAERQGEAKGISVAGREGGASWEPGTGRREGTTRKPTAGPKKRLYRALCALANRLGVVALARWLNRDRIRVLLYHRVTAKNDAILQAMPDLTVSPQAFAEQLAFLSRHYALVSLDDAVAGFLGEKRLPSNPLVVTFDDGFKDNLVHAWPQLKRFNAPATLFVSTEALDERKMPAHYKVYFLAKEKGEGKVVDAVNGLFGRGYASLAEVKAFFLGLPAREREEKIVALQRKLGARNPDAETEKLFLSWQDVETLQREGVDVQPHGVTHARLTTIPFAEARAEIAEAKRAVEKRLNKKCMHFAYPFGDAGSFDERLMRELQKQGFASGLTAVDALNAADTKVFALHRVNAVDEGLEVFAAEAEGFRPVFKRALTRFVDAGRRLSGNALMPNALRRQRLLHKMREGTKGRFLDFGCGEGNLKRFYRWPMRFVGFDFSWRECQKAREAGETVVEADAERVPFASDAFDGIVCSEVLEYVPHDGKAVAEMNRVLKKGGSVYLTVPYKDADRGFSSGWAKEMNKILADKCFGGALRKGYAVKELEKMFWERGFVLREHFFDVKWLARALILFYYHLRHKEVYEKNSAAKFWRMAFVRALFLLYPLFVLDGLLPGKGLTLFARFEKVGELK